LVTFLFLCTFYTQTFAFGGSSRIKDVYCQNPVYNGCQDGPLGVAVNFTVPWAKYIEKHTGFRAYKVIKEEYAGRILKLTVEEQPIKKF
jgi:hypothetical protein